MKLSLEKALKDNKYLIYSVLGQSMNPILNNNDKVHLITCDSYNQFDIVLFKRKKGVYVLHRIIDIKDNVYIIIGDNASHIDYIKKEEILAKLTGIYKEDKFIKIEDLENKSPYLDKKIREELIKDPNQFFLNRLKQSYYELIKLATLGEYNKNKIEILNHFELMKLCEYLLEKKAIHLLGFAVDKYNLKINEEISKILNLEYQKVVTRISKIEYGIKEISNSFNENKINHIILKGPEVKRLYKFPQIRNSNDIDIYVNKNDFKNAKEILINNLKCESIKDEEDSHDESFIFNAIGIKIELHFSISSFLPSDLRYLLDDPFKRGFNDDEFKYRYHLNNEDELLYFLVHTAKHLRVGQFWYNNIIDYYYLKQFRNDELIDTARLNKFNETMNNYIDYIYLNKPLSKDELNFENILFESKSKISKVINIRKASKFKYILSRIFISYNELKGKYTILKKHPILFPFLSIYRWITLPFRISKEGKIEIDALKRENDLMIEKLKRVGLEEYLINQEDFK